MYRWSRECENGNKSNICNIGLFNYHLSSGIKAVETILRSYSFRPVFYPDPLFALKDSRQPVVAMPN
jgi:hypothetical protein